MAQALPLVADSLHACFRCRAADRMRPVACSTRPWRRCQLAVLMALAMCWCRAMAVIWSIGTTGRMGCLVRVKRGIAGVVPGLPEVGVLVVLTVVMVAPV